MNSFDVIVIGLGAVGSAALYQLAKNGVNVLGIDRYDPPHIWGSSHGETRITRIAVGESEDYVKLAARSHELWRELEAESGNSLFTNCGGILMDSGTTPWGKHGAEGFLERTISFAKEYGTDHDILNAEEVIDQFPHFHLEPSGKAYLEYEAGFLRPERCIATQLVLAQKSGAKLLPNTQVMGIKTPMDEPVTIQLEDGEIQAKKILLSAGGWVKDFLPHEEKVKFKICRQILHWVEIGDDHDFWQNAPVYMWGFGPNPEDFIYGFPSLDGKSVKMATESFVEVAHPDLLRREVSEEEKKHFLKEKVAGRFSGLKAKILKSEVCFYTVTEDAKFVVKSLSGNPSALMVSACSGHGFKHSAALGEYLAEKLLGVDLSLSISL